MPDHGRRYANGKLKKVDRELQAIYRQAEKELKEKLSDFVERSKEQDRLKRKQRDAGIITEEEYESWLKGQVFQKKRWEAKVKQVQQVMYNHNVEAAKIVHENKMDVFAENYNYQAFMTEGITGVSFDIYDTDAVAMLIKDRPDLLPEWKIDEPKDYNWNYRKVNNAITQGIIQGESVERVMQRLCDNLCTQNENKMRMFARTAINEAESAGRQKQMEDSAKKGIRIEKGWLATLDSLTRDTHRKLDGQRKPYNEPFKSDLGDIMFPCDPTADPANVYNCRCTMIPVYPDYEDEQVNWRENETVDGMTYQEWKRGKTKINYTENFDTSAYPDIDMTKESKETIKKTMDNVFALFPKLKEHIKTIEYTKNSGIVSTNIDGTKLIIDKRVFASLESAKQALEEVKAIGHTVNTDNPMFMIAHDVGHCVEAYIARKQLGITNRYLNELQKSDMQAKKAEMGILYFLHMGFGEDDTTEEIYATIRSELGNRALDNTSEMAAQAVAQVMYGNKSAPHARKLVEYLISLME